MMQKLNLIKNKKIPLCLSSSIMFNTVRMFGIIYNKNSSLKKKKEMNLIFFKEFITKYKLPETDPLFQNIYNLLKKEKKKINYSYTIFVEDRFPYKNFFLESLKKDIEYLNKKKFFYFAILHIEYDSNKVKTIYITFYFEREIESYNQSIFFNIYNFFSWYHRNYLKKEIYNNRLLVLYKHPYIIYTYIKGIFANIIYNIYYFLHEMSIIDAIDRTEPIRFIQKVYKKLKRWFKFCFSIFFKYSWKSNERYIDILEANLYRYENLNKGRFKNWIYNTSEKIWTGLQQPTVTECRQALIEQFFFPDDVIEEAPFERNLKEEIFKMRTTLNWESITEITDILKINSKLIGSYHFNAISEKVKIK
jgi:hypothetical protein